MPAEPGAKDALGTAGKDAGATSAATCQTRTPPSGWTAMFVPPLQHKRHQDPALKHWLRFSARYILLPVFLRRTRLRPGTEHTLIFIQLRE